MAEVEIVTAKIGKERNGLGLALCTFLLLVHTALTKIDGNNGNEDRFNDWCQ